MIDEVTLLENINSLNIVIASYTIAAYITIYTNIYIDSVIILQIASLSITYHGQEFINR